MHITIDPSVTSDYETFLKIKSLPVYSFTGREAWFPDEYASFVGIDSLAPDAVDYSPSDFLFDYQRDIVRLAIQRQKFAVFAECGLGKSLIEFEFARHATSNGMQSLILTPLMVVDQMAEEYAKFYGDGQLEVLHSRDLPKWLECGKGLAITNWDALKADLPRGQLGCLVCDESSLFKSHYGAYGKRAIQLGKGVKRKLAATGTPAPNDRIEYANHAVFLDQFPTVNSFLAKFFINRGETQNRWELRPHALRPFYRSLSHWCIFLTNPAVYGWNDNCESIPPIHVHIHEVEETESQRMAVAKMTRQLTAHTPGGIRERQKFNKIAKGLIKGVTTNKYGFMRNLVDTWPDESTIIWCWLNQEQDELERWFPEASSIRGETKYELRRQLIHEFKAGQRKVLISKPSVLGYGLNLQIATRQMFSSLVDSYEKFHQAVKRSNRIGSTRPLNVHLPVMEIERPMIETVLRKAGRVQHDNDEQEAMFRDSRI